MVQAVELKLDVTAAAALGEAAHVAVTVTLPDLDSLTASAA